jgi:hypothetical protein
MVDCKVVCAGVWWCVKCFVPVCVAQDLVNRRISMDMMLQMTRNQLNKQFIFLTPQDMRCVSH